MPENNALESEQPNVAAPVNPGGIASENPEVAIRTYYSHSACGHRTLVQEIETTARNTPNRDGDVAERLIEGKQFCDACYQAGLADGTIKPLTAAQWQTLREYRDFSESHYAAGWISNPEIHREEFVAYVKESVQTRQSNPQPEYYEMQALEFLTECMKEAGCLAPESNLDVYAMALCLERAAVAICESAAASHFDFPRDREARQRSITPSVSQHLTPLGVDQLTIEQIATNVSRQLTAETCRLYHVESLINGAILAEAELRAEAACQLEQRTGRDPDRHEATA